MNRRTEAPETRAPFAGAAARAAQLGYAAGFLAFAGGLALLVGGKMAAGAALALLGVLLATAAYFAPFLPWEAWLAAASAAARRGEGRSDAQGDGAEHGEAGASPASRERRGRRGLDRGASAPTPAASASAPKAGPLDALLERFCPQDTLTLNRLYLLAPAILLLAASAILALASTVQGAIAFAGSGLILWVYFQDMLRPLVLPRMRANLSALLAQVPGLPFQACGIWLLNSLYDRPGMVWLGFWLCALASAWGFYALTRWPFDFTEPLAPKAPLTWTPPKPFYSWSRLSLITGLAALACVCGVLAEYVFPGDYAALSLGAAFLGMALLIGSFPWVPGGLAHSKALPGPLSAFFALASAGLAFALGAHGQDLVEAGRTNVGLWFFLAGGVSLILGLSRFGTDLGAEEAERGREGLGLEVAALAALVVAAFCFRIWKIGSFPFGVEGDEGGGGVWAMNTLNGNVETPLIHQNYPLAFFSVTALFFKLGGINIETLRWHAVFFGTVSVATTYFFLRLNMGRAAAFLATALMSFSYWHLHYSRFGHYNIEQVAMEMAAFYFVFKGFRTGKLWQWAAGGLAFGLAMFPHMAGRILPFQGIALLLFLFAGRRDLLRRHLPGFLAFLMLAWAVSSPAIVYWNRARGLSMGRIQSVSIFDKNNTNAPIDTLAGFERNCKVTMMMFNDTADSRTRDNPVAPDRILEHWTAVLFALSLLYVLYHWREPVNFFLLAVFFLNLCASAFSVEAPQTLRTAGDIPIVFAFIAVPLADLTSGLRRAGRLPVKVVYVLLVAAFAFFCWRSARRLFVDSRRMSFDTSATFIAQTAGLEGGPDTKAVFFGTGFASGHPPMELLRLKTPLRNFYGIYEYLPITMDTDKETQKDNLLFLADDYQQVLPYVRWLYPKAQVKPIPDQPGNPDLAQYIRVNKDQIAATEGLNGEAATASGAVALEGAEARWPTRGLEVAKRVSLAGSLAVDDFGRYRLQVTGLGNAEASLDGKTVFSRRFGRVTSQDIVLAKGLHDLSLRMDPKAGGDALRLQWAKLRTGPASWEKTEKPGVFSDVPMSHLLRMQANGLLGQYYLTHTPSGDPVMENVEPLVLNHWLDSPLVGNWSVRWRTRFEAPQAGTYRFSVRGGSYTAVKVDGHLVWRSGADPEFNAKAKPQVPEATIQLKPGWHDYEAVFSTSGGGSCDLDWTTPDNKTTVFWTPNMRPVQ